MPATTQPQPALTAGAIEAALTDSLSDAKAMSLAERIEEQVGRERLAAGAVTLVDELAVAWGLAAPDAQHAPEIVLEPGTALHDACKRLGTSDV